MASRESSQSLTRIEEGLLAEKIALWPRRLVVDLALAN